MSNKQFFKAGIKAAYQDRPCLDPMDPECPESAPNYVNHCDVVEKFVIWNNNVDLADKKRPRFNLYAAPIPANELLPSSKSNTTAKPSDEYDYYDTNEESKPAEDPFASLVADAKDEGPKLRSEVYIYFFSIT